MTLNPLRPDAYFTGVTSVSAQWLAERGLSGVLVDLDNTLAPRDTHVVDRPTRDWLARLASAGVGVCVLSNNWHSRVQKVGVELGLPVVGRALKPLPSGFRRAAAAIGRRADECAVIGDQIFTDVLGGNLTGATTVLVEPVSKKDLPHTLLLRRLEALIMAGKRPEDSDAQGPVGGVRK